MRRMRRKYTYFTVVSDEAHVAFAFDNYMSIQTFLISPIDKSYRKYTSYEQNYINLYQA